MEKLNEARLFEAQIGSLEELFARDISSEIILISNEVTINDDSIKKLKEAGLTYFGVYGGGRSDLYEKIDSVLREIDCDNMPEESWSRDFRSAMEGYLLSEGAPRLFSILSSDDEIDKINSVINELSVMTAEEIRKKSPLGDTSAPSRFEV